MKDIAYQNKDITQKFSAELLKNKSLAVYGLPDIYIKDLLPTNLPAVEANELRMDNLFVLGDDTLALIDYESSFGKKDVIKYANYIARILKRYESDTGKKFPYLQLISLPLTVKGREEKRKMAEKSVMLADHIADDDNGSRHWPVC